MTPEQIHLVETSFAKITPIADQAAVIFYDDLFDRAPELQSLFKGDMAEQRRKLMAMLGTAVANLRDWQKVAHAVRALGERHISYGVKTNDYDKVGASLIATLEKGLGPTFTPDTREAWVACYAAVRAEMLGPTATALSSDQVA